MNDDSDRQADHAREISLALRALLQAGREMNTALARRLDVGVTDLQAMDHLVSGAGDVGPAQLATLLGIRSASASVLVDRLESAGHLRRSRTTDDRRRIRLEVTDDARAGVRTAMQPMLAGLAEVTERLDPREAAVVLDFLTSATRVLRDFAAAPPPD